MKKKQFESLCKKLLPHLPGFRCKGWYLYAVPVNHILRGFCCDRSAFAPNEFTVWRFFMPLYVPTNFVSLLFGDRLRNDKGGNIWWDINDPQLPDKLLARIREQGLPFIESVR